MREASLDSFKFDQAKQFLQRAREAESLAEREAHLRTALSLLESFITKLEGQADAKSD